MDPFWTSSRQRRPSMKLRKYTRPHVDLKDINRLKDHIETCLNAVGRTAKLLVERLGKEWLASCPNGVINYANALLTVQHTHSSVCDVMKYAYAAT